MAVNANVIIKNGHERPTDLALFFGEQEEAFLLEATDWADVLVQLGIFPSKSQARKNGRAGPLPPGFSEHKIGKNFVWLLNATEVPDDT